MAREEPRYQLQETEGLTEHVELTNTTANI